MDSNNTSLVETAWEIAKYVITFILGILFTPIKKLIYSEEERFCSFVISGSYRSTGNNIKVTKWFRKTISINCGWFKERTKSEFNQIKFLICPFGKNPPNAGTYHGGYCPFDKIPKFKQKQ